MSLNESGLMYMYLLQMLPSLSSFRSWYRNGIIGLSVWYFVRKGFKSLVIEIKKHCLTGKRMVLVAALCVKLGVPGLLKLPSSTALTNWQT